MHKTSSTLLFTAALTAFSASSCKDKDYFDKDEYEELVAAAFPVTDIDPGHDWQTIAATTVRARVETAANGTYRIYDRNPLTDRNVTLLAEGQAYAGRTIETALSVEATAESIYIALTDGNGKTTVYRRAITADGISTSIGSGDSEGSRTGLNVKETPMSLQYCFEDAFPQPDDFDYNDIIMTLTPSIVQDEPYKMRLTVSLDAVGSTKQIAAALRLKGIRRSDILKIETDGEWFDATKRSPASVGIIEADRSMLVAGTITDEAVIYLFNDAHWAMDPVKAMNGSVFRPYYNTKRDNTTAGGNKKEELLTDAADISPRTCTMTIMFSSEQTARSVSAANLDAFIVESYNGINWEVHTFPFKLDKVLYDYDTSAYKDRFAWALLLPGGTRHAREGKAIGSYSGANVLGGAFQTFGHSFAEWVQDRNKARDWYRYPLASMTY